MRMFGGIALPVHKLNDGYHWKQKESHQHLFSLGVWSLGIVLILLGWRFISGQTIWLFAYDAPRQASNLVNRMLPPNWTYAQVLWRPLWDTLTIATLGTIGALMAAVPVAFMTARNTTPHVVVRQVGLMIIVVSRSVNSLIWALMLVAVFGPGVLSGIIAIALRSVGFVGKLLYEAIEEVDPKPVEAVTATGASVGQVISFGVLPQVMPALAGISVYRWDINIRESTVVGLVGAGGIGLQLNASVLGLRWANAMVIFVIICALVIVSEWISAQVRRHVV